MNSISIKNQVSINNTLSKLDKKSNEWTALYLFQKRDEIFDNYGITPTYAMGIYIFVMINRVFVFLCMCFFIYNIIENKMTFNDFFSDSIFYVNILFLVLATHFSKKRIETSLEYFKNKKVATNKWMIKRGKIEFTTKIIIHLFWYLLLFSYVNITEINTIKGIDFFFILIVVSGTFKLMHCLGILFLSKRTELLSYKFSISLVHALISMGNIIFIVAVVLCIVGYFFIGFGKEIPIPYVYLFILYMFWRVYRTAVFMANSDKHIFYTPTFTRILFCTDENIAVSAFEDDYQKFKRKVTANGEIKIYEKIIQQQYVKNQSENNKKFGIAFLLLTCFVTCIATLALEIFKEYVFKQSLKPVIDDFLNNGYIITPLFIGGIALLLYVIVQMKNQ